MADSICCTLRSDFVEKGFQPAADKSWHDGEGRIFISNDEYTNQVNFCPFCGKEAKNKEPLRANPA